MYYIYIYIYIYIYTYYIYIRLRLGFIFSRRDFSSIVGQAATSRQVKKVSNAATSLCMWTRAMDVSGRPVLFRCDSDQVESIEAAGFMTIGLCN